MIRSISLYGTLAKNAHDSIGFPMCKITYFSQDIQTSRALFFFCEENPFHPKSARALKFLIMSRITEKCFFANDFPFICVPICQRPLQRAKRESILYYYNLYRFFHLHRWDIVNSCITLRTERIDVHPVFTSDDYFL